MSKNSKTILITGGAGYIGGVIAQRLGEAGYQPILFDKKPKSSSIVLGSAIHVRGNMLVETQLKSAFSRYRPIAVVHCASLTSVVESASRLCEYYKNNVIGGIRLLQAMDQHACSRLIFTSSAAVYGHSSKPIAEDALILPDSAYGSTKRAFEEMLEFWDRTRGGKYIVLRLFNVVGSLGNGVPMEDSSSKKLIPQIIRVSLRKQKYLKVYGGNFLTTNGTSMRDYVHVDDVARATVLALEQLLDTSKSNMFNIGAGKGHTVLEVVQAFEKVVRTKIPYRIFPKRPNEIAVSVANIQKAQHLLGWAPVSSGLEYIVRSSVRSV